MQNTVSKTKRIIIATTVIALAVATAITVFLLTRNPQAKANPQAETCKQVAHTYNTRAQQIKAEQPELKPADIKVEQCDENAGDTLEKLDKENTRLDTELTKLEAQKKENETNKKEKDTKPKENTETKEQTQEQSTKPQENTNVAPAPQPAPAPAATNTNQQQYTPPAPQPAPTPAPQPAPAPAPQPPANDGGQWVETESDMCGVVEGDEFGNFQEKLIPCSQIP